MKKILVVFSSLTGNTEMIARNATDYLRESGYSVDLKSFNYDEIDAREVVDYDAVLIGTYTWDDGTVPYELEDFYDDLADIDLTDKVFGVFGSADSFYEEYGGAVDLVGERIVELGAELVSERLKIDIEPAEDDISRTHAFAELVVLALRRDEA